MTYQSPNWKGNATIVTGVIIVRCALIEGTPVNERRAGGGGGVRLNTSGVNLIKTKGGEFEVQLASLGFF